MNRLETLETRRLMSVNVYQQGNWGYIDGTSSGEHVIIEDSNANLVIKVGGTPVKTLWGVNRMQIGLAGGSDRLSNNSGKTDLRLFVDMGNGDDLVEPGFGPHSIQGGGGLDEVSYAKHGANLYLCNNGTTFSGYRDGSRESLIYADVEHLRGGSGNDQIVGNNGMNRLKGGPGNDLLVGSGGSDFLLGEGGNDTLIGGTGADSMWGGIGSDTLFAADGERDWAIGGDSMNDNDPGYHDVVYGDWVDSLVGVEEVHLPILVFHP
jgi:Ca2+-binding RTX toxin-like protein